LISPITIPPYPDLEAVTDINDAGQMTGWGRASNGRTHAFMMTPVPEPSSFIVAVLGGVGLLGWQAIRRTPKTWTKGLVGIAISFARAVRHLPTQKPRVKHSPRYLWIVLVICGALCPQVHAGSVTYNDGRPYEFLPASLLIPQWDQAAYPGQTLSSVTVGFYFEGTAGANVPNLSGATALVFYSASGSASLTLPHSQQMVASAPTQFASAEVPAFSSAYLSVWLEASEALTYTNPIDLEAFTGVGSVSMLASVSINASAEPPFGVSKLDGGAGVSVTYEWTPVPEPPSVALGLAGITILGIASCRCRRTTVSPGLMKISRPIAKTMLTSVFLISCGLFGLIRLNAAEITLLHSFSGVDGRFPSSGLAVSGNTLFGITSAGGTDGAGTVFKIEEDGSGFEVLHHFVGPNGGSFFSALSIVDSTIFGTTGGAIFKMNIDGSGYQTVRSLDNPSALTFIGNTIYGAAMSGGSGDEGILFKVQNDGTDFNILHDFTSSDGINPRSLMYDGSMLYGSTYLEGSFLGGGTVFSLAPDGSDFTVLHRFTHSLDVDPPVPPVPPYPFGAFPVGDLVISNSMIYGVTNGGGSNSSGIVYRMAVDGADFTILHEFTNEYGPFGGLTLVGDKLYGTTIGGNRSIGSSVFSIGVDGTAYRVVHSFQPDDPNDGVNALGTIAFVESRLLGITLNGGSNNIGTIYSIEVPEPSGIATLGIGALSSLAFLIRQRHLCRRSRFCGAIG
jgi:uncharacterized repeat protein (TIGR03803 family)